MSCSTLRLCCVTVHTRKQMRWRREGRGGTHTHYSRSNTAGKHERQEGCALDKLERLAGPLLRGGAPQVGALDLLTRARVVHLHLHMRRVGHMGSRQQAAGVWGASGGGAGAADRARPLPPPHTHRVLCVVVVWPCSRQPGTARTTKRCVSGSRHTMLPRLPSRSLPAVLLMLCTCPRPPARPLRARSLGDSSVI